jgi:hypothetical protein
MKSTYKKASQLSLLIVLFMSLFLATQAQKKEQKLQAPTEYGSGFKVNFNEDGSKYFRLITWHQFWLKGQLPATSSDDFTLTPSLRRSRFLMFAQLTDRFLILTHLGLNNLSATGLDPTGQSSNAQLFMHDAWIEYKVFDFLYLGGGLHYWNGISRGSNQSTLNMLPLDNPRHAWATIGTSDQFARHLGIYAKGKIGKIDYRFAWNQAMVNSIDQNMGLLARQDTAVYTGRATLGLEAAHVFAGYVNYEFWDQESNKLPYFVGTYFGGKKVFNLGAGFYSHPKGTIKLDNSDTIPQNVNIFAVDAFLELPFGQKNSSATAYLSYQNNNYGQNYQLAGTSQSVFTGGVIYFQGGIVLPHKGSFAWQPYITLTQKSIEAYGESATDFGFGINALISGHHAKLTLEYRHSDLIQSAANNQILMQAVVFL